VVDVRTGARPRLGQAIIRSAIPLTFPVIGVWAEVFAGFGGLEPINLVDIALAIAYAVLTPLWMMWSSIRTPGKRTPWDRWTRTMVRYRTRRSSVL
jgi:hypothetical protein